MNLNDIPLNSRIETLEVAGKSHLNRGIISIVQVSFCSIPLQR